MQKRPEDGGEDRKREDRRVRRTRASIRRAFLDLLDEKSYGQITVTELSESAFDCCVSLERTGNRIVDYVMIIALILSVP